MSHEVSTSYKMLQILEQIHKIYPNRTVILSLLVYCVAPSDRFGGISVRKAYESPQIFELSYMGKLMPFVFGADKNVVLGSKKRSARIF